MPDFLSGGKLILQPNDILTFSFKITTCSDAISNDGFIGFGRTVNNVTAIIYDKDNQIVTDQFITGEPPESYNNVVSITLKYPVVAGSGRYKLTFILTLDNGNTKEADFHRIYCEDK